MTTTAKAKAATSRRRKTTAAAAKVLGDVQVPETVRIINVTPELAAQWLSDSVNVGNRRLDKGIVARYTNDMVSDHWSFTGDPIQFDRNGKLRNGQHRLNAIMASGKAQDFVVVINVEEKAVRVMDAGLRRSLMDQLNMDGYTYSSNLAAASRMAYAWSQGTLAMANKEVSDIAVREFFDANSNTIVDLVKDLFPYTASSSTPIPNRVAVSFAFQAIEAGADRAEVIGFFEDLANFATNGKGDPKAALLSRIATTRAAKSSFSALEWASMVARVWNAIKTDTKVYKIQTRSSRNGALIAVPEIIA